MEKYKTVSHILRNELEPINKIRMKCRFLKFLFLIFITIGCQKTDEIVKRENEPNIHLLQGEDVEMNLAIDNAKKTIDKFKTAITSQNPDYYNFALKERFKTDDEGGEHIWISEIQYYDNKYFGIVDGKPISTTEVKFGDTIEVKFQNITDWMYFDKNIVKGAYTTKVLRKRISQNERDKMDKESGMKFENE